jgi:hypothetical protein
VAEDLGTWPPEQARVLLEALQKAGLSPKAKRTREGVSVTVEDAEADEAHRTLVANMDAIAQAARGPQPQRQRSRARQTGPQRRTPDEPRMASQRLGAMSRPLVILLVGLVLAAIAPAPLRLPLVIATVAAIVYVIGRRPSSDDEP